MGRTAAGVEQEPRCKPGELIRAAEARNVDRIRHCLQHGSSIDEKDIWGSTALHLVSCGGDTDIIRTIIEFGALANEKDNQGRTALFDAAENDNVDAIRTLIELGVSANEKDKLNETALFDAAENGNVDAIRTLVELGASPNKKNNEERETALFRAAENDNVNAIRTLIELCVPVNKKDIFGNTALFNAAENDKVNAIRTLIELCVPVNKKDIFGNTALFNAAENDKVNAIRALVELGASVNEKNNEGETALFRAACWDRVNAIRTLIELGASVNEKDKDGNTALFYAAENDKVNALRTLFELGASVNEKSNEGETALFRAARWGGVNAIRTLIELGASVNEKNNSGETALFAAAANDSVIAIQTLIDLGAIGCETNSSGETALCAAARAGKNKAVKALIKLDADVNHLTPEMDCPLLLAGRAGHMQSFRVLIEAGASINMRCHDGETPLISASRSNYFEGIQLIIKYARKNIPTNETSDSQLPLLTGTLETLRIFCASTHEFEPMFSRLVKRLEDVSIMQNGSESHLLTLVAITFRLCSFLLKFESSKNDHPLSRFIASRVISNKIRDFHEELDHFTVFSGTEHDLCLHLTWKEQWREDRLSQQVTFQVLLRDDNLLTREFSDSEQHVDRLFQLQYELRTCEAEGDFGMCTQIQGITDRLVALVNLKPPVIPECAKKYRGTWKKASVVVASSSLKLRDFEARVTQWFSLRHPNIVALYGACHVAKPPFFVCEYDLNETSLEDFLKVKSNRHLVWEKLYEAALGIHHLHQRQVAHGDLKCENIVISRNGQAKVGGLEVNRFPEWESPEQAWYGEIASLASDIFSFGICILEAAGDRWNADDAVKLFRTTNTIRSELENIMPMLSFHSEVQWIKESVYPALQYIYKRCVESRLQLTDPAVTRYCVLLARVKHYVRVELSVVPIARLARSQKVAERHHVIFAELDHMLDMLQVPPNDPIRSWERDYSDIDKQVLQHDRFIQDVSVIGPKNEAVTLTHSKPQNESPLWGPTGRPILSDTPPPWYLALRDVHFKQTDSIGKGEFGTVYKGTWLDSPVVVKFMGYEEDPGTVSTRLFLHEVRVWHELNHPHIIKLFGANHCDKRYFVCEFAANGDLLAYLKRNNCSISDKWKKMYEIALGLQYMHERNIVHNDLKCDNILVGANGDAKIIDFGLSCIPDVAEILVDKAKMGAVNWKSPEYLKGERLSIETDIYSLAMCILEVLTDDVPWGRNMLAPVVSFRVKKGEIPCRLAMMSDKQWNLIELMTKLDPAQRVKAQFVVDKLLEIVNSDENNDLEADSS
ncbi:Serine/threonine protein kinase, partial [Globisporangium splendens]